MSARFVSVKTMMAPPVELGAVTVTPVARFLSFNCRVGRAVWAWPSAVLVAKDGRTSRHRIFNVNRILQTVLLAIALLAGLGIVFRSTRTKEKAL
jgi:hypothetical protein